ncbi:MAG: DUF2135 domain-containing protein [Dysgonamonadaceae bacterium]|nr:DUF2135 domain-containing protein [Dysgonamonadaceae bacterium]
MKRAMFLTGCLLFAAAFIASLLAINNHSTTKDEVTQSEIPGTLPDISSLEQLPASTLPVMKIKDGNSEVYLQSLDIQVEVTGNIATTRYVMVFKNRTGKILEGELLFPLPDGITVSHYALDINGKMREAVPVEKAKATQVFEEIEQRRVDPGLLERVEGNNFRTRIYPIPAHGTRAISIGYEEELSAEKGYFCYRLPMAYPEAIENFSVKASVWKSKSKPQILGQLSEELSFDEQGENFVATFSRNNYQTGRALIFALPAPTNVPQTLIQPASGSYYFTASCIPKTETRKKTWDNTLGIIWDASLSGMCRDHAKELDVLDRIIREKKNLTVNLYFLNNRMTKNGTYKITNGNWPELRKALESVVYDGGTNFEAIRLQNISSGEFLFFSDGLSTLSDADFIAKRPTFFIAKFTALIEQPIHCIVSSAKADYSAMKWIAAQSNGKFINLNALSADQLQNELMYETLHFLGIEPNHDVREIYPSVSTPVRGNFSIAGILDASRTSLTLRFGYGNKVEQRITVNLNTKDASQQANVHRIWAQKKINELDMCYEKNKEELTELGQQFGIVTRNTSLIVLETLQDYITYNIVPPVELQAEYFRWKKDRDDERLQNERDYIAEAISAANILKNWWNTDFTPKKQKYPKPDGTNVVAMARIDMMVSEDSRSEHIAYDRPRSAEDEFAVPPPPELRESVRFTAPVIMEDVEVGYAEVSDELVLVEQMAYADMAYEETKVKESNFNRRNVSQPTIKLALIKQDNAYTKQLTGKLDEDYAAYLKLRPEYINTPTFYFDMADWFFRHNDRERALRILTSIADLDLENASLFRLLGYRLKEYKEYPLEAYICKKVIQWRPMEPQSYRDYALALADNGNYQAALDNLYSVLTQSYAQNIAGRSQGIEEVVVTEINQLIAKNPKLRTNNISKELIQAMPVDIRVVINWNMNSTDIDLHLTDPNGETCCYSNRETALGGRISNDITQGYGPEQFMLKKAIKGKYSVYVNYYGDSQVKAEGPSTVMAEIYTRYADKTEQRQVVCLQLSKENKQVDGKVKVAEFNF